MVTLAIAVGYFTVDKFVLAEGREARMLEQARSEGRAGGHQQDGPEAPDRPQPPVGWLWSLARSPLSV